VLEDWFIVGGSPASRNSWVQGKLVGVTESGQRVDFPMVQLAALAIRPTHYPSARGPLLLIGHWSLLHASAAACQAAHQVGS
jgi:hypothetical protein